jgi:hypothetical protein
MDHNVPLQSVNKGTRSSQAALTVTYGAAAVPHRPRFPKRATTPSCPLFCPHLSCIRVQSTIPSKRTTEAFLNDPRCSIPPYPDSKQQNSSYKRFRPEENHTLGRFVSENPCRCKRRKNGCSHSTSVGQCDAVTTGLDTSCIGTHQVWIPILSDIYCSTSRFTLSFRQNALVQSHSHVRHDTQGTACGSREVDWTSTAVRKCALKQRKRLQQQAKRISLSSRGWIWSAVW